jgi:hypothetical protein
LKVRKAKQLEVKPEQNKFIDDIVNKSRAKVSCQLPPEENTSSGFARPVVEYSPDKKGDILPRET